MLSELLKRRPPVSKTSALFSIKNFGNNPQFLAIVLENYWYAMLD